jgi:hypothetical protein
MTINPRLLLAVILFAAVGWFAITVALEISFGWPHSAMALGRRAIGWAVYFWVFKTLWKGFRRYSAARS